jgi:hypothetical protein
MYDKFNERRYVSLGAFQFSSSHYEIWSGGQLVKSDKIQSIISFKTLASDFPSEDGIEVSLSTFLPIAVIANKLYFDVGYTNNDRVLLGIIPNSSNCEHNDSFKAFVTYAPLRTRQQKIFRINEPHACSVFFINGIPSKVTFSIALSKMLIEFYI